MAPLLLWKVLSFLAITTLFSTTHAAYAATTADGASCWQYKGCYNETDTIHPLQFKILPSLTEDTNNENCQSACLAAGYLLSGTSDAYNCWCDNILNPQSNKLLESYCNDPCDTVTNEICGGYYAVSVYNDTCLTSPPVVSKTIILTSVPVPTVPVHTIYTTVVVVGPGSSSPPPVKTVVTYVAPPPTTSNPYSSSRQRPYIYSRTTAQAAQPTEPCTDILCCLFDPNCNTDNFNLLSSGLSLVLGSPHRTKEARNPHHSKETPTFWSWPQSETGWSTSTIFSTTTYTITSCPPWITSCGVGSTVTETISVSTTVCPVTETQSASTTLIPIPISVPTVSESWSSVLQTSGSAATSSSTGVAIVLTSSLPTPTSLTTSEGISTSTTAGVTGSVSVSASASVVQVSSGERFGVGLGTSLGMFGVFVLGLVGL